MFPGLPSHLQPGVNTPISIEVFMLHFLIFSLKVLFKYMILITVVLCSVLQNALKTKTLSVVLFSSCFIRVSRELRREDKDPELCVYYTELTTFPTSLFHFCLFKMMAFEDLFNIKALLFK